jgi:hypothetical protein
MMIFLVPNFWQFLEAISLITVVFIMFHADFRDLAPVGLAWRYCQGEGTINVSLSLVK